MGDTTRNQGRPPSGGASDSLYQANSDLRATAAELQAQAGKATSQVRDEATGAFADVKAEAAGVADEARDRAMSFAEQQKKAGADQAANVARAVNRAADELQQASPQLAQYVREAADSVDYLAKTVRDRSMGDLVGEVQDVARRQPAAFFGAAVLAGFALSRFVKSSAEGAHQEGKDASSGEGATEARPSGGARAIPTAGPPGYTASATSETT